MTVGVERGCAATIRGALFLWSPCYTLRAPVLGQGDTAEGLTRHAVTLTSRTRPDLFLQATPAACTSALASLAQSVTHPVDRPVSTQASLHPVGADPGSLVKHESWRTIY